MKTYLVGGAVRDSLLGLEAGDRDWVVVGATQAQMEAQGFKAVGSDFPVFLHPHSGEEYALARTERKSGRGYRGFVVDADPSVTLEEDLLRRDFTLNAIARDEATGELVDPWGGVRDIEQRVLRHVGPAFVEDPLRVLRAARFMARFAPLGFTLAPETANLMQQIAASGELDALVPERIWQELRKALRSARPGLVLTLPVEWINTNLEWNPRPAGEAAFLQAIAPSLDRINVMTYDMAAAYEGWNSWFSSPFNGHMASTPSSVSSSMQYYLDAGVPAARLGMGFGFFGNCFRGVEWPRMAVTGTNLIASDGAMSYRNILASYRPQMTLEYDPVSAVFLHSPAQVGPMGCNLVTYEDPLVSTPVKAGNARDSGYGAAILWTISQGYLPSEPAGQRDPLLTAIKQSYLQ